MRAIIKKKQGFTLLEISITISVILFASSFGLFAVNSYQRQAVASEAGQNLRTIQQMRRNTVASRIGKDAPFLNGDSVLEILLEGEVPDTNKSFDGAEALTAIVLLNKNRIEGGLSPNENALLKQVTTENFDASSVLVPGNSASNLYQLNISNNMYFYQLTTTPGVIHDPSGNPADALWDIGRF